MAKIAKSLKDLDALKVGETVLIKGGLDIEVIKEKDKRIAKTRARS